MSQKTQKITVRIAPSPTGKFHLGTARTALFNWLFAEKENGNFLLRWEDTDQKRSKKAFEEEILAGMAWLGLDLHKKNVFLYRQTDNNALHQEKIEELWEKGAIFPCFCTTEESDRLKDENGVFFSPWRDEKREILEKKRQEYEKNPEKSFVWRIKCPKNEEIAFEDAIRGKITVSSSTIGDFAIARADKSVLFLLANVIDDAFQVISHVIRGEDHISNTPKQILLYNALGFAPPVFAHIPLVLDTHKKKLSKRNTDPKTAVLIEDFKKMGFLPEAVVNGLSVLGFTPKTDEEILTLDELARVFELSRVQKAAAMYDMEKMYWFGKQWIQKYDKKALKEAYLAWAEAENHNAYSKEARLEESIAVLRPKCRTLADIHEMLAFVYEKIDLSAVKNMFSEEDWQMLPRILFFAEKADYNGVEELRNQVKVFLKDENLETKAFLSPFRVALSGKTPSPSPFELMMCLGREKTINRIKSLLDAA